MRLKVDTSLRPATIMLDILSGNCFSRTTDPDEDDDTDEFDDGDDMLTSISFESDIELELR